MKKLEMNEYLTGLKAILTSEGVRTVTTNNKPSGRRVSGLFFVEPELPEESLNVICAYMSTDDDTVVAAVNNAKLNRRPEAAKCFYHDGEFYTEE